MDKTLEGELAGAAMAAAAGFARESDESQRKLRMAMDNAARALRELDELKNRSYTVRSLLPVVMDWDVGLSTGHVAAPMPTMTPSTAGIVRPNLAFAMAAAISDLKWPPKPGQFDDQGNIVALGEMATLSSAMGYEELRAFLLGLVQDKQPTPQQKVQIFAAANALVSVLYGLNLTGTDYTRLWERFFSDTIPTVMRGDRTAQRTESAAGSEAASAPTASVLIEGVTSVVPLGLPDIAAYPYEHQNTDRVSKWRVQVGAQIPAGSALCQVSFGASPWLKNGKPYQPVVLCSSALLVVSAVSAKGFTVSAAKALNKGAVIDVGFAAYGE